MNILHVKSIEFNHIFCVSCGSRRSLPFKLALPSLLFLFYNGRNRSAQR